MLTILKQLNQKLTPDVAENNNNKEIMTTPPSVSITEETDGFSPGEKVAIGVGLAGLALAGIWAHQRGKTARMNHSASVPDFARDALQKLIKGDPSDVSHYLARRIGDDSPYSQDVQTFLKVIDDIFYFGGSGDPRSDIGRFFEFPVDESIRTIDNLFDQVGPEGVAQIKTELDILIAGEMHLSKVEDPSLMRRFPTNNPETADVLLEERLASTRSELRHQEGLLIGKADQILTKYQDLWKLLNEIDESNLPESLRGLVNNIRSLSENLNPDRLNHDDFVELVTDTLALRKALDDIDRNALPENEMQLVGKLLGSRALNILAREYSSLLEADTNYNTANRLHNANLLRKALEARLNSAHREKAR